MREGSIVVENMVFTLSFPSRIDLERVARELPNAKYNSRRFPSLVVKLAIPKVTFLIFESGRAVCTGARSEGEMELAVRGLLNHLRSRGIELGEPEASLENVVVSSYLGGEVDVERLSLELQAPYEPERFPGAIVRYGGRKVLVFSSGRIVCTGLRTLAEAKAFVEEVRRKLSKFLKQKPATKQPTTKSL